MPRLVALMLSLIALFPCALWAQEDYGDGTMERLYAQKKRAFWRYHELSSAGRYAEAEAVLLGARAVVDSLVEEIGYDGELAEYWINWVELLCLRGEYEEAERVLQQPLCPDYQALRYTHLSNVYLRQGRHQLALAMNDSCLRSPQVTPRQRMVALQNRGYIYGDLGQRNPADSAAFDSAVYYLSAALPLFQDTPATHAVTLGNLAVIEARRGNFDKAVEYINEALDRYTPKDDNDYYILLRKRAEILLMKDDKVGAQRDFLRYYHHQHEFVMANFAQMTEQKRLDFWKTQKPLLTQFFALEGLCPDSLLDLSVFCREVAMLGGANAEQMRQRLAVDGRQVRAALREGECLVDFIRYNRHDTAWYGALVVPSSKAAQASVRFLPLWSEAELNNFKVGNTSLRQAVCSFLDTSPGKSTQPWMTDKNNIYKSEGLAKMVWTPILKALPTCQTLYFVPDGLLQMLAIEYLPHGNLPAVMHRLTSPTLLTRRTASTKEQPRRTASNKAKNKGWEEAKGPIWLLVTALDYDKLPAGLAVEGTYDHEAYRYVENKIGRFEKMRHGSQEHDSLLVLLPQAVDSTTLSEESAKLLLGKYQRIYLSTHGYSLKVEVPALPVSQRDSITEDRSLLSSGIACSGSNVAHRDSLRDDGLLSSRELCDLDLRGVDFIILSACQTAEGRVNDEGPAGVVRGLKKAGVHTIMATLWPVNEKATYLYMVEFFKVLNSQEKSDYTQAANKARQYLRRMNSYTNPYYWAPFILIDDL